MKQRETLPHATHVNGWFPAVYMSCMIQNCRLLHVSNLSAQNFRVFLLVYSGSVSDAGRSAARVVLLGRSAVRLGSPRSTSGKARSVPAGSRSSRRRCSDGSPGARIAPDRHQIRAGQSRTTLPGRAARPSSESCLHRWISVRRLTSRVHIADRPPV